VRCEVHAAAAGCVDRKPGAGRCLGILHIASCLPTIGVCPTRHTSPLPLLSYSLILAIIRALAPSTQGRVIPHPRPTRLQTIIRQSAWYRRNSKDMRNRQQVTSDTHKTGVQSSYFFTQRVKASESVLKASVPRNLLLYPLKAKMQHGHVLPMSQKQHEKWTCT